MSIVHETKFQTLALGDPCSNKEGQIMTVVGINDKSRQTEVPHEKPVYDDMKESSHTGMVCLYYDKEQPNR